jgi:hypothetical protein
MASERNWLAIGAAIAAFIIVIHLISFLWFPFLPWMEQRQAGEEIVRDQMEADKAVENYRWFRQQYHDIQAQRNQIENYYDQREQFYEIHGKDPSEWSRSAETRHGRIQDRITGSQNMLEQMTADYNARSDDATRALFKCHLPYQVDERFAIQGPPGSDSPEQPQDEYVEGADRNRTPPEAEQCDALPSEVDS